MQLRSAKQRGEVSRAGHRPPESHLPGPRPARPPRAQLDLAAVLGPRRHAQLLGSVLDRFDAERAHRIFFG